MFLSYFIDYFNLIEYNITVALGLHSTTACEQYTYIGNNLQAATSPRRVVASRGSSAPII